MRIFYTSQDGYVGAHFIGKSNPIDDLVKRRGFELVTVGKITGPIYRLALGEGDNSCEVTVSYSNRRKGIQVLAASNNKEYLSGTIRGMLAEVNASDSPRVEQQSAFLSVEPVLIATVRDFATEHKRSGDNHAGT